MSSSTRLGETRVLGISGSLRADSVNTALLHAARAHTRITLWNGLGLIPPFNEDGEDQTPASVSDMRIAIKGAAALLISTPEYNGSVPGQLKNALDWASRPYGDSVLHGKPVAVVGASPGDHGAAWAVAELRKVLGISGARVLDVDLALPLADRAFDAAGGLHDRQRAAQLAGLIDALEHEARAVSATAGT